MDLAARLVLQKAFAKDEDVPMWARLSTCDCYRVTLVPVKKSMKSMV